MSIKGTWKKTRTLNITESHLLIPMIWEGDLNIHSNVEWMKNSNFNNIILHGDTSLSIAIHLIEQHIEKSISYDTVVSKYKSFLCLNDEVSANYHIEKNRLTFVLLKQKTVEILEGELLEIEVER